MAVIGRLRRAWSDSRVFRVILVVCLVYLLLRLIVQGAFLGVLILSGQTEGHDLQIYIDAAGNLQQQRALYPQGAINEIEFYQYSPAYALSFVPFRWLSFGPSAIILTLLHIVAYVLLYFSWARILERLGLEKAGAYLAWTLPLWLCFSAFWSDLLYINVYIFMALLATLSIEAILYERLGLAVLWLSIILQVKPQWAFAVALPLLLGRYRFFLKLTISLVLAYVGVIAVTMLLAGPAYVLGQYTDYFKLLLGMSGGNYAWKDPTFPFLGYNHSITQVLIYLFGVTPGVLRLSLLIRLLLLLPLGVIAWHHIRRPVRVAGHEVPRLALDLVFALYLGAFIWLNVVWELTLSIVVFVYLLSTMGPGKARVAVWGILGLYALLDFWRVASVAIFGFDIVLRYAFVLTDPALYLPLVMVLILTFYALLVKRLWVRAPSAVLLRSVDL